MAKMAAEVFEDVGVLIELPDFGNQPIVKKNDASRS
jgi:hypothetical protein